MFGFQCYIKDVKIVPKPARLERKHPKAQSPTAQRYLENQELLRDEFWLAKLHCQHKGKHDFPLSKPMSMRIDYLDDFLRGNHVLTGQTLRRPLRTLL